MRAFLIVLASACSGAPSTPAVAPSAPLKPAPPPRVIAGSGIDVVAALAQPPGETASIVIGPAQLVAGGTTLEPREAGDLREVDVLDERGSEVRVGVRTNGVRFAVWTARSQLLAVLARDHVVASKPGSDAVARLHAGARVHVLSRKDGVAQVRFIGLVEIEGGVPENALAVRGPTLGRVTRQPFGSKTQLFTRGAVIRSEPRTFGTSLAVLHHSAAIDVLKQLDDEWYEVGYRDKTVFVRGFLSRRAPPGRVHLRSAEEPMPPVETNAKVPAHTCLYINDEPIGFIDSELEVALTPARAGWFTLTVDTPWGHTAFEAKGSVETQLATCP